MNKQANRIVVAGSVAGALALGIVGGVAVAGRHSTDVSLSAAMMAKTPTDGPTAGKAAGKEAVRPRLRVLARKGGVHGEATVRTKGGFAVRAWQRGDVTSASSGSITVKSADGTSWTWKIGNGTRVRKAGQKAGAATLATGDKVLVVGTRTGDTRTSAIVNAPKKSDKAN
ncbi:hypothetical protein Pth03_78650 [Planotetraspora thailandica]|uniref:DUF5666 domain-containing protein n=1 Tax=Planotetraspora thailandica TaxID=487172 RepID=A0A8J4DFH3_9ACTN|nr:hypothetical protein [Planotetraspora thailandica]GII59476.1 hypothetical protein Pth03_78650 [Planotetraspora thailandica]